MAQKESVFKKIDYFIFKKIDEFNADSGAVKLHDLFTSLPEQESKIIQQILAFGFILIPFLVVLFLFWGNYQIKGELAVKNEVINEFQILNSNRDNLQAFGPQFLSDATLRSQSDLENKIRDLLTTNNIDQTKVTFSNFEILQNTDTYLKSTANINFTKFGNQDFSSLMKSLVDIEKFKISSIKMNRESDTELLGGVIEVIHLGRNIGNQDFSE